VCLAGKLSEITPGNQTVWEWEASRIAKADHFTGCEPTASKQPKSEKNISLTA